MVIAGLDLADDPGKFQPFVYEDRVLVSDGALSIGLVQVVENPMISGIEIFKASAEPPPTASPVVPVTLAPAPQIPVETPAPVPPIPVATPAPVETPAPVTPPTLSNFQEILINYGGTCQHLISPFLPYLVLRGLI